MVDGVRTVKGRWSRCAGRNLKSRKRREKCTGMRRSGRQANRYASESIFARYTTVLHSECIPRHTGMHKHTLPLTLCPPLATLMWHDSQWLPRFAATPATGTSGMLVFTRKIGFRVRSIIYPKVNICQWLPVSTWTRMNQGFEFLIHVSTPFCILYMSNKRHVFDMSSVRRSRNLRVFQSEI